MRGTYFSGKAKLMGTIGVLNLATAAEADRAGSKAGRAGYIRQLAGRKGPDPHHRTRPRPGGS